MDIQQEKNNLKSKISSLLKMQYVSANENISQKFQELFSDITNDNFTIVVLGEFKRGKSTFINALLGKSLLPMGILPETATINVIHYSDVLSANVVYSDGYIEKGEPTYTYLKQFSACQNNDSIEKIKYINIGYPAEFLKNNIILVDTPGVSDLSEQRTEVTYSYIPKANAVIFLLDSVSPLKETERNFIRDKLLPLGINNIMFIANRYDFVDEDEEEDYLVELKQRLLNAFKINTEEAQLKDITLYPLSALQALQGIEENNSMFIELSGINEVRSKLNRMLIDGNIEQEKLVSYQKRFQLILKRLLRELKEGKSLYLADKQELEKASQGLTAIISEVKKNKNSIACYTEEVKEQIYSIVDKSVAYFNSKLKEDITDMIDVYQGQGFKEYVEITVTKRVKGNYESWLAIYSGHIDNLLNKLEMELSRGLSYHFKQQIRIQTDCGKEIETNGFNIKVEAEDLSGVNVEAGAKAAAIGIGLFAIAGGGFLPLISFAALPYMREKIMKERLAAAKSEIKSEMLSQIAIYSMKMQSEVHDYINSRCYTIIQNTEFAYEKVLADLKERIDKQLEERSAQSQDVMSKVSLLDTAISDVQQQILLLQ